MAEVLTVTEGNILIAALDGYVYYPNDSLNGILGVYRKADKMPMLATDFKYHNSWNALMPVAYKIKCYPVPEQKTKALQIELENKCMRHWEEIAYSVACINIEMTWKSILSFIKLHKLTNA
jgi:hypothetical protein